MGGRCSTGQTAEREDQAVSRLLLLTCIRMWERGVHPNTMLTMPLVQGGEYLLTANNWQEESQAANILTLEHKTVERLPSLITTPITWCLHCLSSSPGILIFATRYGDLPTIIELAVDMRLGVRQTFCRSSVGQNDRSVGLAVQHRRMKRRRPSNMKIEVSSTLITASSLFINS